MVLHAETDGHHQPGWVHRSSIETKTHREEDWVAELEIDLKGFLVFAVLIAVFLAVDCFCIRALTNIDPDAADISSESAPCWYLICVMQ